MASYFGFPAYGGKDKRVFISYKKADEAIVSQIAFKLHQCGVNVWYDMEGGEGLKLGEEWEAAISQNMTLSSVVISFISRSFFSTMGYMRTEFNMAHKEMGKPMIVVFLDDVSFNDIDISDRSLWSEINSKQTLSALGKSADEIAFALAEAVRLRIACDYRDIPALIRQIEQEKRIRKAKKMENLPVTGKSSDASSKRRRPYVYVGIVAAIVLALALVISSIGGANNNKPVPEDNNISIIDSQQPIHDDTDNDSDKDDKEEPGVVDNKPDDYFDPDAVYSVGDYFFFGSYEQDGDSSNGAEPIEWRVLAVENDRALIISEYCLDRVSYYEQHDSATWAISSLRSWLNESFYNEAFTAEEQSYVLLTEVENADNPEFGTNGGSDTQDYIFCLSIAEAAAYFNNDDSRIGTSTQYARQRGAENGACWWWLRSPGNIAACAARVNRAGQVNTLGNYVDSYEVVVRPAFYISLQ